METKRGAGDESGPKMSNITPKLGGENEVAVQMRGIYTAFGGGSIERELSQIKMFEVGQDSGCSLKGLK